MSRRPTSQTAESPDEGSFSASGHEAQDTGHSVPSTSQGHQGQTGQIGNNSIMSQATHPPAHAYSATAGQPRQRQTTELEDDHDDSTAFTTTQSTPAPNESVNTWATPTVANSARSSEQALPSSTNRRQAANRRGTSEERDGTYRGKSPDPDISRQSGESGKAYKTRSSLRNRALAEADTAAVSAQPQGLPAARTAASSANATNPLTGKPEPSTSGIYTVPPQLQGVRRALGEPNWRAYVNLIEQRVDGTISEAQLNTAERRIFESFNERMRQSIRKKMCKMVETAKSVDDAQS